MVLLSELRRQLRKGVEKAERHDCQCCAAGGYPSNCDCDERRLADLATPANVKRLLDALDRAEKIAIAALGKKLALAVLEGSDE